MPRKIVIIGCGVIGAAIAYELSQFDLDITVIEGRSAPGQGSTKSALGVMMAACSTTKNATLTTLRLTSLRRYESLVPELEAKTGISIPYNRNGILLLSDDSEIEAKWQDLIGLRAEQGFRMEWLDRISLRSQYPQLQAEYGLYSYDDRAINPSYLVRALVTAAKLNGVKFESSQPVQNSSELDKLAPDWIVVAAGLGSSPLINSAVSLKKSDILVPVGGQAIEVYLPELNLKKVIHGADLNIVPIGADRYWIGATVEFEATDLPRAENTDLLIERAIKFCPALARAKILSTWAGDRPRPKYQGSPIIGFMPDRPNTLIATGHYRNGVLMAPVTAQIIRDLILKGASDLPWQKQQLKF
jgi:glycine oxidase